MEVNKSDVSIVTNNCTPFGRNAEGQDLPAIPLELKNMIFNNLSIEDRNRAREVCKEWKQIIGPAKHTYGALEKVREIIKEIVKKIEAHPILSQKPIRLLLVVHPLYLHMLKNGKIIHVSNKLNDVHESRNNVFKGDTEELTVFSLEPTSLDFRHLHKSNLEKNATEDQNVVSRNFSSKLKRVIINSTEPLENDNVRNFAYSTNSVKTILETNEFEMKDEDILDFLI
jgi:F-box domain